MKPILEARSKWEQARAAAQRGLVILLIFVGLGVVRADSTNFVGDFGPALWTLQPDQGNAFFTNGNTEVVLTGPNQSATPVPQSFDGILYDGALPGGLRVGGTVEFHWEYNPGTVDGASAEISWTPPGSGSPISFPLVDNGGLGFASGDFSTNMVAGTTFDILLTTDTLADKLSGTLTITDFQFRDVPEPSSGALLASAVITLGAARWRRRRRQASGRP